MAEDANVQKVPIAYRKSTQFRVVLAEGCFGGVTNKGMITSTFYNERGALPRASVVTVQPGQPTKEEVTESLDGVVRELEVEVAMDFPTAILYHAWLGDKIDTMRKHFGMSDEDFKKLLPEPNNG